jgi:hypothetical protein
MYRDSRVSRVESQFRQVDKDVNVLEKEVEYISKQINQIQSMTDLSLRQTDRQVGVIKDKQKEHTAKIETQEGFNETVRMVLIEEIDSTIEDKYPGLKAFDNQVPMSELAKRWEILDQKVKEWEENENRLRDDVFKRMDEDYERRRKEIDQRFQDRRNQWDRETNECIPFTKEWWDKLDKEGWWWLLGLEKSWFNSLSWKYKSGFIAIVFIGTYPWFKEIYSMVYFLIISIFNPLKDLVSIKEDIKKRLTPKDPSLFNKFENKVENYKASLLSNYDNLVAQSIKFLVWILYLVKVLIILVLVVNITPFVFKLVTLLLLPLTSLISKLILFILSYILKGFNWFIESYTQLFKSYTDAQPSDVKDSSNKENKDDESILQKNRWRFIRNSHKCLA